MEIEEDFTPQPQQCWGKLISIDQRNLGTIELNTQNKKFTFGRLEINDFSIPEQRLSGTHFTIQQLNNNKIQITDNSSNGTFIRDQKIGKGQSRELYHQDIIFALKQGKKVKENEQIAFRFEINMDYEEEQKKIQILIEKQREEQRQKEQFYKQQQLKNEQLQKLLDQKLKEDQEKEKLQKEKEIQLQKEQEMQKQQSELLKKQMEEEIRKKCELEYKEKEEKLKKENEQKLQKFQEEQKKLQEEDQKKQENDDMAEELECPICMEIMYQCVSMTPCLHNVCGACAKDWLTKNQKCVSCNNQVEKVRKNPSINNVIEKYLKKYPEKQIGKEIREEMDKKFTTDQQELTIQQLINLKPKIIQIQKQEQNKEKQQQQQQQQQLQKPIGILNKPIKKQNKNGGLFNRVNSQSDLSHDSTYNEEENDSEEESEEELSDYDYGQIPQPFGGIPKQNNNFNFNFGGQQNNNFNPIMQQQQQQQQQQLFPNFNQNILQIKKGNNPFPKRGVMRDCQNCEIKFKTGAKSYCTICGLTFCNLTKNCTGKSQLKMLKKLDQYTIPKKIHPDIFKGNKKEVQTLEDFLKSKHISTQDIYNLTKNKMNNNDFNFLKKEQVHEKSYKGYDANIRVDAKSLICGNCFPEVWFQIIFQYRMSIKDQLEFPNNFTDICPFGLNCRTVEHDKDHENNFDHITIQK